MHPASAPASGPDRRRRDRRGRGMRGPAVLSESSREPRRRGTRARFDALVLAVVSALEDRWSDRLGLVEYAVEDTPQVPEDWQDDRVPLASLVRGTGTTPTRLVVFRRPIERRAHDRSELEALVVTVVVEQVAELLGLPAEDVDPRYRGG